jgi:hypothetical protein
LQATLDAGEAAEHAARRPGREGLTQHRSIN